MLDYKLIEALAMVAREQGFEKAARRLHITQSAVSQRIKMLEAQSGQILLARTSPPRPTRAGQRWIKHYEQVRHLETDLFDTFSSAETKAYVTVAVGINSDSLATWFPGAVSALLKENRILLDLRLDDQAQTQQLLKDGEVIGCISDQAGPVQGCRADYLGRMDYRMVATPEFMHRWFADGMTLEHLSRAPLVIFNQKDRLHDRFFHQGFERLPPALTAHYLPSTERFMDFICDGLAYGMLPDQQCATALSSGRLKELLPGCRIPVKLYWHCWNLKTPTLEAFSRHLVTTARRLLPQ